MAANSKTRGLASIGKRFLSQIEAGSAHRSTRSPSVPIRSVHTSVYEKNPDEQLHPTVVPDDVIQAQSDKYWAPHPETGVFGPATDHKPATGREQSSLPRNSGGDSVLEEKAFFRPLEDLEKPPHP